VPLTVADAPYDQRNSFRSLAHVEDFERVAATVDQVAWLPVRRSQPHIFEPLPLQVLGPEREHFVLVPRAGRHSEPTRFGPTRPRRAVAH
jgi:hypothetical protein